LVGDVTTKLTQILDLTLIRRGLLRQKRSKKKRPNEKKGQKRPKRKKADKKKGL
jgi:hypothetical protein